MMNSAKKNEACHAFSLIELLISLIVISCITAAFTPVITKKLKTSAITVNSGSSSEITTECTDRFSSSCKLCTKSYCVQCELSGCSVGTYAENKTCTCKDCSNLFPDCIECVSTKCTKCLQTHYIKEGRCEICPADKICDGVNAYDRSYCDNPPAGYFCDGTTPKSCKEGYNNYCKTCNSTQCTSCELSQYLSGGLCKPCSNQCYECIDSNHCTRCQPGYILDTTLHKCTKSCESVIPNCSYCSDESTCNKCFGGYYLNSSKSCTPCTAISNCISCSNASICTKCQKGYYVNSSNTCSQCSVSNCAQCDKDGSCLSCNQGYHLAADKRSCVDNDNKFNCSDSNFMQIGNLCVTRKNMGDSTMLPIPNTVNVANAVSEDCYAQNSKCCWKGETSRSPNCDSANGGYSGCTRTACNWEAAKEICAKFTYGGKNWRLPTKDEMANWAINSIALEENGLMLCDSSGGHSSARCAVTTQRCRGSYNTRCYTRNVWSSNMENDSRSYYRILSEGNYSGGYETNTYAFSVRCVTEIE